MKIALLSDIHANLQGFEACLAHARAQGAERFALLGDLVGYGADPCAVLELCMQLVHEEQALAVLGNHDAMALAPPANVQLRGEQSAQWTHDQLGPAHKAFLQSLPLTARIAPNVLLVHASADTPARWDYVQGASSAERCLRAAEQLDPAIRYVFCGHMHEQALYFHTPTAKLMRFAPQPGVAVPVPGHRHWLAVVGSSGQPRDGDPRVMYALFDALSAQLTFHRVAYDMLGAAAAVRRAGLPAFDAERLELGQ